MSKYSGQLPRILLLLALAAIGWLLHHWLIESAEPPGLLWKTRMDQALQNGELHEAHSLLLQTPNQESLPLTSEMESREKVLQAFQKSRELRRKGQPEASLRLLDELALQQPHLAFVIDSERQRFFIELRQELDQLLRNLPNAVKSEPERLQGLLEKARNLNALESGKGRKVADALERHLASQWLHAAELMASGQTKEARALQGKLYALFLKSQNFLMDPFPWEQRFRSLQSSPASSEALGSEPQANLTATPLSIQRPSQPASVSSSSQSSPTSTLIERMTTPAPSLAARSSTPEEKAASPTPENLPRPTRQGQRPSPTLAPLRNTATPTIPTRTPSPKTNPSTPTPTISALTRDPFPERIPKTSTPEPPREKPSPSSLPLEVRTPLALSARPSLPPDGKVQKVSASEAPALFELGQQWEERGKEAKDKDYLSYAVEAYLAIPPGAGRQLYVRSRALAGRIQAYQLGQFEAAAKSFEDALKKDFHHPILHYELAYSSYKLGRLEEAIRASQQAGLFAAVNPVELDEPIAFELQRFLLEALSWEALIPPGSQNRLEILDALLAWRRFLDSCHLHLSQCPSRERERAEKHESELSQRLARLERRGRE